MSARDRLYIIRGIKFDGYTAMMIDTEKLLDYNLYYNIYHRIYIFDSQYKVFNIIREQCLVQNEC